ncbi:MAG: GNAT family N-acetyltransferase [Pirellulaceae bacterium]
MARQVLVSALRGPSLAELQSQLDDPFYEPRDRLLGKVRDLVVGHVRLARREIRFGQAAFPSSQLTDLVVLPEFRHKGCGTALLAAAEEAARSDGSVLALLRTNQPYFFLRRGWCVWTRHSFSTAGAHEILARLCEAQSPVSVFRDSEAQRYNIRLWRHIELDGLTRLYERNTAEAHGPLVRTDAYWQWLLARHAFDRIYVALDGPDRNELDESPPIMGYAVVKGGRILELMAAPDHPEAATELLARICADAVELNVHGVRLDAPVGDPLHRVLACSGGQVQHHEAVNGDVCLVKLLDAPRAIELLSDVLLGRARTARLPLPLDLGLQLDNERYVLEVRGKSVGLRSGRGCRSYVRCASEVWTQLLLGHLDVGRARASQRLVTSTRVAEEAVRGLFPQLPLWRPPWDDVPAG